MKQRLASLISVVALGGGALVVAAPATASGATGPEVTVGDASVTEGDSGTTTINLSVDLSTAATAAVKLAYTVGPASDGSADPTDAVVKNGTMSFPIGVVTKPVSVTVRGDTTIEPNEHFAVHVTLVSGPATIGDATGVVTIRDDDTDGIASGIEASVGTVTVEEADSGTHNAYLPITLSRPPAVAVVITYKAGCSTATAGTDFGLAATGKVTFLAGQRTKLLAIRITPDTTPESLESLIRTIATTASGVTIESASGTATIVDNDPSTTPQPDPLAVGETEQVSVQSNGSLPLYPPALYGDGGHGSAWPSISNDGRAVAFVSDACTLVPGDTNGLQDLFVRDRISQTTERVSLNADGTEIQPGQLSNSVYLIEGGSAQISGNGRYVAYTTRATGIVAGDTRPGTGVQASDVFVFDREARTTELVSSLPDGTAAGGAGLPSLRISDDGRFVAYAVDQASTLLPATATRSVFLRDRQTGSTTEYPELGTVGGMSGDGRFLVGRAIATGLDGPIGPELVVDRVTHAPERVDVTSDGTPAASCLYPPVMSSLSTDGRYVGFVSCSWNLIPGRTGPSSAGSTYGDFRIYVRDRLLGTTTLIGDPTVSVGPYPVDLNADATMLLGLDASGGRVWDLANGGISSFSIPHMAAMMTPDGLSADGHYVAFTSSGSPPWEVYVRRLS